MFTFKVEGQPIPQGSKTATVINGRAVMFDSNKKLKAWRSLVSDTIHQTMMQTGFAGFERDLPLIVHLWFELEKPKTVKRKHPSVKPDVDKLIRSIFDSATTAGLWRGDEQVIRVVASKAYSDTPGVKGSVHNVFITEQDTP